MKIIFPEYPFKIKEKDNKPTIFDIIRKKYVSLTPEEWVRQHLLHYLTKEKSYPRSLIAVEKSLMLNDLIKRSDIVTYNKKGEPEMLIECKAPEVKLTQNVLDQAARYNLHFKVPLLVVSNGHDTYCFRIDRVKEDFHQLDDIPEYGETGV